jgi:hypothetical protein
MLGRERETLKLPRLEIEIKIARWAVEKQQFFNTEMYVDCQLQAILVFIMNSTLQLC